ncbi:AAA family ATPase [Membranihabitans maritimus]|uniref:AAA family ATPase n=1 Tax=Membranihabitans maritimus TaxID=2904244 RepID=UPI001F47564D|nr:SMC family ATPase [Membranihabitans maritimus]
MIPVKLTIQGLYSYQSEPQTIDFDPLLGAGLFGIFGSVGSGKSSILEAITLALYGNSERLNKSGDDRNYNMMNLKSDSLLIDYEFQNYNRKNYRFVCKGRRNSRRYTDVGTYKRTAFEWKGDQWVVMDHTDGGLITGLTYENFRRTVIIPQGKFQEFLELSPSHRSEMLKELFNLSKFDFSQETSSLQKQTTEKVHHLEGRLTGFVDINREKLKEYQLLITNTEAKYESVHKSYIECRDKRDEQKQLKQWYDQLAKKQNELDSILGKGKEIQKIKSRISLYREASKDFEHFIKQVGIQQKSIGELKAEINKLKIEVSEAKGNLKVLGERYESLSSNVEQHESKRKEGEDARKMAQLIEIERNIKEKETRIQNGGKRIDEEKIKLKKSESKVAELKDKILQAKEQVKDRDVLFQLKGLWKSLEEVRRRMEEVDTDEKERIQKFSGSKKQFIDSLNRGEVIESQLTDLLHKEKGLEELKVRDYRNHINQLSVQKRLSDYAGSLKEGEPCPLCGSESHPSISEFGTVQESMSEPELLLEKSEKKVKDLDQKIMKWGRLQEDERELDVEIKKKAAIKSELVSKKNEIENQLSGYRGKYPTQGTIDQLLETTGKIKKDLDEWDKKYNIEINKQEQIRENLEKFQKAVAGINNELNQLFGSKVSVEKEINPEMLQEMGKRTKEGWIDYSSSLFKTIEKEKSNYQKIKVEKERVKELFGVKSTALQTKAGFLEKEESSLKKLSDQLKEKLDNSSFNSLLEVENLLQSTIDVEKLETEIRTHEQEVHSLEVGIKETKEHIGNRKFDITEFESLNDKVDQTERLVGDLREKLSILKNELKESNRKWKVKQELEQELSELETRQENLKILAGMFRANGFVDYVSTIYLREICSIADQRFRKLTHNHYSLELSEDNHFLVRDFLNNGYLRNIKTLSGGQTFQASLCLALALAETLQQQNRAHQNFFFLDEGFGTLDSSALQLVFDTLKSLRKEGRVVGVISHVEDLQTEIDMHLRIENNTEHGSLILKSWEN